MVIHFTRAAGQETGTGTSLDKVLFSSSPANMRTACERCGDQSKLQGVLRSCLDCFLSGDDLYVFHYSVSPAFFLAEVRGGTCTLATSDPVDAVLHRANYLLNNGFGNYCIFKNNCEDFAIYCKTGLLLATRFGVGRSGQLASLTAAISSVTSCSLRFLTISAGGLATAGGLAVVMYCVDRYVSDIGIRTDVVKIPVERLVAESGVVEPEFAAGTRVAEWGVVEPELAAGTRVAESGVVQPELATVARVAESGAAGTRVAESGVVQPELARVAVLGVAKPAVAAGVVKEAVAGVGKPEVSADVVKPEVVVSVESGDVKPEVAAGVVKLEAAAAAGDAESRVVKPEVCNYSRSVASSIMYDHPLPPRSRRVGALPKWRIVKPEVAGVAESRVVKSEEFNYSTFAAPSTVYDPLPPRPTRVRASCNWRVVKPEVAAVAGEAVSRVVKPEVAAVAGEAVSRVVKPEAWNYSTSVASSIMKDPLLPRPRRVRASSKRPSVSNVYQQFPVAPLMPSQLSSADSSTECPLSRRSIIQQPAPSLVMSNTALIARGTSLPRLQWKAVPPISPPPPPPVIIISDDDEHGERVIISDDDEDDGVMVIDTSEANKPGPS